MDEPVAAQLVPFPEEHRAIRYTLADRDAAYGVWRTVAGRSVLRTSQLTGINRKTLDAWRQDEGWPARADADDRARLEQHLGAIAATVAAQVLPSILTAVQIRDDPTASNKDRLAAAMWLAGLAAVSPVQRTTSIVEHVASPPPEEVPDYAALTTDELIELQRQALARRCTHR
jgi:hypothetical protein